MTILGTYPANRQVIHGDSIQWLRVNPCSPATSVITSLPDVSEVPHFSFDQWRNWFIETSQLIIRWVPIDGVSIFFQSDIRYQGKWIDKGYLVMRAAEIEGANIVWHKIVCRKPAGTTSFGRALYSHMICISRAPVPTPKSPSPDVISDAGFMPWNRAMGENACKIACRFLRNETATLKVVDPFCGQGSVLAVANHFGFEATGIDISVRRCREARKQILEAGIRSSLA